MNLFNKTKKIHFIGIGGIGMSGMAEFLFNHGFQITGSDISISDRTKHLSSQGIKIFHNHDSSNISNQELIVYSSAINENNNELLKSKKTKNKKNQKNIKKQNTKTDKIQADPNSPFAVLEKLL